MAVFGFQYEGDKLIRLYAWNMNLLMGLVNEVSHQP
jgi:hypothetical protein